MPDSSPERTQPQPQRGFMSEVGQPYRSARGRQAACPATLQYPPTFVRIGPAIRFPSLELVTQSPYTDITAHAHVKAGGWLSNWLAT